MKTLNAILNEFTLHKKEENDAYDNDFNDEYDDGYHDSEPEYVEDDGEEEDEEEVKSFIKYLAKYFKDKKNDDSDENYEDFDLEDFDEEDFGDDYDENSDEFGDDYDGEDSDENLDGSKDDFDDEDSDSNYQGTIRTIKGAKLVYKRQSEDGDFTELWIFNNDSKSNDSSIKRAILAGTDIPPNKLQSDDGSQRLTITSVGNVQFLKITGLSN
jgi:hypothetical protein